MTQTALILGANGKVGDHVARAFRAAGWSTRAYQRGTDMTKAALGCDVIFNGLNPPNYHDWATILPAITTQVLAAAKASGATVLFPGNVYVYGSQPGPWDDTTPHRPVTRKGRIRAEVEARYRDAAADGVQTIILHAGDFIDPDSDQDLMSIVMLRKLDKGIVTTMGDPDADHAYAYLPDMARVMVMLAEKRAELPAFSDTAFPGHTLTTRELTEALSQMTGHPLSIRRFPWWALRLGAPFSELARELSEMRYLYDTPHRLSGKALSTCLPDFRATPLGEVLRTMLPQQERFATAA
ncbi:epimerase [Rhodobacter sp. NTK016B]|uniref:NAD-dependent epimerase/dehydratase family protein n=1 Tax=Rhodobacter sp. NTK016B TaxID=2759676 RepID=UPI001A8FEC8D|nr:NAD-dependent epimerase/dehydratase family protein [Rhodobacter sp. NTK016B]MBN8291983.1 epimerase [Rhodobacter sp. NTK016B]